MGNRVGGKLFVAINGVGYRGKGNWVYGVGADLRETVVGTSGVDGYTENPQAPYAEGEITDRGDIDLKQLANATDVTVTLELANGKTFVLREAWAVGPFEANSEDGHITVRFEGLSGEEI